MDSSTNTLLLNLGFSQNEINHFEHVYNNGGKFTPMALQQYGYTYEQAKRLNYMSKILRDGINMQTENDMISHVKKMTGSSREMAKQAVYRQNLSNGYGAQNYSEVELIKHLRETNGKQRRITIQDLAVSKVTAVPRVAVVAGITDEPYTIWNSKNYKGYKAMYKVVEATGSNITIETPRKPKLAWGQSKKIPGVLEIKGVKGNGDAVVVFNKNYCRLCNRFVIVASLKNPEFHLGKYEMICFEGTRVYIFAINMGTKENVRYNMGNQRIYEYGIMPGDIKGKLDSVAKNMFNHLGGVSAKYVEPNEDYKVVPKEDKDEAFNKEESVVM